MQTRFHPAHASNSSSADPTSHTYRLGPTRRIHCALTPHSPQTLHPLHTDPYSLGTDRRHSIHSQRADPLIKPLETSHPPHTCLKPWHPPLSACCETFHSAVPKRKLALSGLQTPTWPGDPGRPTALYGAEWRRGAGVAGIRGSTATPSTTGPRRPCARQGAWSQCLSASLFLGTGAGVVFPCACLHPGWIPDIYGVFVVGQTPFLKTSS